MAKIKSKIKSKSKARTSTGELDAIYILKLTILLILSSTWVHIGLGSGNTRTSSWPLGAVVAIALAMHDRFKIDRKIEYALILLAMFAGYWLSPGITILV